jgi:serine protease Do
MKTAVVTVAIIILAAGLIVNVLLSRQQSNQLDTANQSISSLRSDLVNLKNSVTNFSAVRPSTASSITDIVSALQPSVLRIDVVGKGFVASGSGFIIRSDGYFLTNHHVIDSATSINVTLMNGQQMPATVKTSDVNLDLAICKLNSSRTDFPVLSLGVASDIVVGADVVAIGFPLGTDLPGMASFTHGIVSAIRTIDNSRYIQTDATINPGNSGCALVNYEMKAIGITSSAVLPSGLDIENIGLAIPCDVAQAYINNNLK